MAIHPRRPTWLATAALLALAGCDAKKAETPVATAVPAGQQLTLAASDIADMKTVSAEITSRDQADARARLQGTLVDLRVRAGDRVARGQRIGNVSDSRLGYEASAAGAQVAAADAEAIRARADLARIEDLYRNKVYAKARLDTALATARTAESRVAAARAQQGASASMIGQGAVLAPASGRVLRADVPAGSVVSPGQSIATITAGPPVLRLMLPESLADRLRIGAVVTLADPIDGARTAQIVQVYPLITGGQVIADASLPGLSERFIGRRIGVALETGRRRAIVLPRRFVTTRFGIDYVDVIASGQVSAVPVQIAAASGTDTVEILSGVGVGDIIFRAADAAK